MEQQKTAKVERFKCLWTPNKYQVRKRWHDGILHFHTFNFRAMLYDKSNVLVDDLFILKRQIILGDEIEFDNHLVIVEDTLESIYSDISSLYIRDQKAKILKKRQSKKQFKTPTSNLSCTNTLYNSSKQIKTKKCPFTPRNTTTKEKKTNIELLIKQDTLKHKKTDSNDTDELFISDAEAYDLFSQ